MARIVAITILMLSAGCAQAPRRDPPPRILRDRRPEVLSQWLTAGPAAHRPSADASTPTTQPWLDSVTDAYPGATVPPFIIPLRPADPSRYAPRTRDAGRDRDPTDPSSPFDRRYERRDQQDDLRRLDPRLSDPPRSIWERDFDPDRR